MRLKNSSQIYAHEFIVTRRSSSVLVVVCTCRTGVYHLIIANVQLEDDAVFECQVGATDVFRGLQSRRAKLTVQSKLRLQILLISALCLIRLQHSR